MYPFSKRGLPSVADRLDDDAPEDPYSRWGAGVVGAIFPMLIGIVAALNQQAYFLGVRPIRIAEYSGKDAIALSVACTAVGMFMHAHYFWSASRRFYFISEILKPLALLLLAAATGFVVVNQIVFL